MNSIVLDWCEKNEHIDEMKGWDKGKLKIWEQKVVETFPIGAKILDIGSGMGREAFSLDKLGFDVIGLDISTYAVEKSNEEALRRACKTKFHHYDGEHIPFKDELFDVVVIWSQTFGLLYGDRYKERFLRECMRTLKPGGLLSYSGHSRQFIKENYNDYLEGNKFYPYKESNIYWETYTEEELKHYARKSSFQIILSGEGEIYKPEDGIVLYCLAKKGEKDQ